MALEPAGSRTNTGQLTESIHYPVLFLPYGLSREILDCGCGVTHSIFGSETGNADGYKPLDEKRQNESQIAGAASNRRKTFRELESLGGDG